MFYHSLNFSIFGRLFSYVVWLTCSSHCCSSSWDIPETWFYWCSLWVFFSSSDIVVPNSCLYSLPNFLLLQIIFGIFHQPFFAASLYFLCNTVYFFLDTFLCDLLQFLYCSVIFFDVLFDTTIIISFLYL